MYIYSWSGIKKEAFSKNVRLYVRMCVRKTSLHYIHERVKLIEFAFFCLKDVLYTWNRPERTKTYEDKAKLNFERLCSIETDR